MRRLIFLTAVAVCLHVANAHAQSPASCNAATIPLCSYGSMGSELQIKPRAVPTSAATVTAQDAYLRTVVISNATSGAITFTLADRQASPVSALGAVSIAANTTYVISFPDYYWCPGGFTVVASGSGLTWYGVWRQ
jgi:hypothetical protein